MCSFGPTRQYPASHDEWGVAFWLTWANLVKRLPMQFASAEPCFAHNNGTVSTARHDQDCDATNDHALDGLGAALVQATTPDGGHAVVAHDSGAGLGQGDLSGAAVELLLTLG